NPEAGRNRHGGASGDFVGSGGGTSITGLGTDVIANGTPNVDAGKCGYQSVNGILLPIGGQGGKVEINENTVNYGGYGFGGGGGSYRGTLNDALPGGGGGGYSGGFAGQPKACCDNRMGGGGGGSYLNPAFVLPVTGKKAKNSATDNPANGFVEYQCFATNPVVTQDLYFQADKGTEVQVLKTGDWVLLWQYDGNLVLYQNGVAKWASNTQNKGTALRFQGDGNLVIYQNGVAVWASNTANDEKGGKGGRKLVLTSEGGLFIIDQDGKVIWQGH
ncbi:MAG: hypothetical protein KDD14_25925, partial [Saprospiraceae bacterium]|nr:hypothetical protein [Saprospiraceae bacterium]